MGEYEEADNLIETDPATLQTILANEPDDDNILRTRTYDVSITYDEMLSNTSGVAHWIYDESRMLYYSRACAKMSVKTMRKTVTIEDHPHLPGKHASVHLADTGCDEENY
ncbi:E2-like enzyme [Datura stramonium]|uniref:E2-like enzyme n=1 Tax=Datura stramonium TaxID=4076 RepID=A0ABS8WJL3_DATST|nr:E2-like enzyme [Datura stramonium]